VILDFLGDVTACKPYDDKTDPEHPSGCQDGNCEKCIWTTFICADCERYGKCEYRFKPKILATNRRALHLHYLTQKYGVLPYTGGICDQPAKLMRQFDIIDEEIVKQQKINQKLLEDRAKQNAGSDRSSFED
jgi:hypothetical protein